MASGEPRNIRANKEARSAYQIAVCSLRRNPSLIIHQPGLSRQQEGAKNCREFPASAAVVRAASNATPAAVFSSLITLKGQRAKRETYETSLKCNEPEGSGRFIEKVAKTNNKDALKFLWAQDFIVEDR